MKNIFILTAALLCVIFGGCSSNEEVRIMPEFSYSATTVTLYKPAGSSFTGLINTTEKQVEAIFDCDWLQVDVNTKRAVFTTLGVNETGDTRTTEVLLTAGAYSHKVLVKQLTLENSADKLAIGQGTEDGLGMVFWIDPEDSSIGKAVSLSRLEGKPFEYTMLFHEATSKVDGASNTALYLEHTTEEAAGYCRSLGEGWYLPAQNELADLFDAYNGISHNDPSFVINNTEDLSSTEKAARAKFDKFLTDLDGTVINKSATGAGESYWSSTESNAENTFGVRFGKWALDKWKKSGTSRFVRCVRVIGDYKPPVEPATLAIDPMTIALEAEQDKSATATVTTNQDASTLAVLLSDASWLSYTISDKVISFTALSDNTTGDTRSTTATITVGVPGNMATATVTISQAKMISVEPWKIGDIVADAGAIKGGIVIWVDPTDGTKGRIISLDRQSLAWATEATTRFDATSTDGKVNTQTIAENANAANVPALAYCQGKGTGWYWPSKEELTAFYDEYNGGHGSAFPPANPDDLTEGEKNQRQVMETLFLQAGADPINSMAGNASGDSYWASNETSSGATQAFYVRFGKFTNSSPASRTGLRMVRCMRDVTKTE